MINYAPINNKMCIMSHSSKSGTIGSLTSLEKITISPVYNIQIGWNKRHSTVKTSCVTLIYVSFAIAFYLYQARSLFRCTIFSRTPCMFNRRANVQRIDLKVPLFGRERFLEICNQYWLPSDTFQHSVFAHHPCPSSTSKLECRSRESTIVKHERLTWLFTWCDYVGMIYDFWKARSNGCDHHGKNASFSKPQTMMTQYCNVTTLAYTQLCRVPNPNLLNPLNFVKYCTKWLF